jgi:hypothetical protein
VLFQGGWDLRYAEVLVIGTAGRFGLALVDTIGDGREISDVLFHLGPEGWREGAAAAAYRPRVPAFSGNGSNTGTRRPSPTAAPRPRAHCGWDQVLAVLRTEADAAGTSARCPGGHHLPRYSSAMRRLVA